MTGRLNARMDEDLARKVRYLRERTGSSTTKVIIASLEAYYARLTQSEEPASLLKDFVGCAVGPAELSSNYKEILTDSLASKHSPTKPKSGHKHRRSARSGRRHP